MKETSTLGMMKLFAVELVVILVAVYPITAAVVNNTISMTAGLAITAVVFLSVHLMEYYLLDV